MKNKNVKNFIIVIGLVAFILLFTQSTFLGSLLGGYENNEPTDLGEFLAVIDLYNGQYSYQGTYDIDFGGSTHNYNMYYTNSDLGVINVHAIDDVNCDTFLQGVSTVELNSTFVVLKGRQVLDLESGYFWCNFNNNLALRVSSFSVLNDYVDSFEQINPVATIIVEELDPENDVPFSPPFEDNFSEGSGEEAGEPVQTIDENNNINTWLIVLGVFALIISFVFIEKYLSKKKVIVKHKRSRR